MEENMKSLEAELEVTYKTKMAEVEMAARDHQEALNAERQELIEEGMRLEEMTDKLAELDSANREQLAQTKADLRAAHNDHYSTKDALERCKSEVVELELACSNHEKTSLEAQALLDSIPELRLLLEESTGTMDVLEQELADARSVRLPR